MGLILEVVAIGQEMDVDSGETMNRLTFRLPDGTTAPAIVTDATAAHLIGLIAQAKVSGGQTNWGPREQPAPPQQPSFVQVPQPRPRPGQPNMNNDVFEFGGDAGEEEPDVGYKKTAEEEPPRARPVCVGKDEMGYPIMRGGDGTRDPGEVVGQGETDEMGVPSV